MIAMKATLAETTCACQVALATPNVPLMKNVSVEIVY